MEGILLSRPGIVYFYGSPSPRCRLIACLYSCFFRMFHLGPRADAAYRPISPLSCDLCPLRDASRVYDLTVLDCLRGVEKTILHAWLDADSFSAANWSKTELLHDRNMSWIVPGKLLAFAFAFPSSMGDRPNGAHVATAVL
jgi:cell division cycle 14